MGDGNRYHLVRGLIMPIKFTCPHCGNIALVADQYAGQSGPCVSCGATVTIPYPVQDSPFRGAGTGQQYAAFSNPDVRSFADKKVAAGICGILLGGCGIHKFILGFNTAGAIMLSVFLVGLATGSCIIIPLLASVAMQVIGLAEGIIYLTKSDGEFYQTYAIQKKDWF
jgi:TM2 domain-containing membrane protein YozV